MKKSTHVQCFKDLASLVKGRILRNSLKCLQMIFLCFFSQKYKTNKDRVDFSNESYNEEQKIERIILRKSIFLTVRLKK